MSKIERLPDWLRPARKFKAERRAALKELERAIREARSASRYLPDGVFRALQIAHEQINLAVARCSEKEWGR